MTDVQARTQYSSLWTLLALLSLLLSGCTDCDDPDPNDRDSCQDSILYLGEGWDEGGGGNRSNSGSSGGSGGGTSSGGGSSGSGTSGGGGSGGSAGSEVFRWGQADNEGSFDSGEWHVDNQVSPAQGSTAVHPPNLKAGDTATLDFSCAGREHTQLSFLVRRLSNNTELELFDGDQSRGKIEVNSAWSHQIINVDPGVHTYRFVARNLGTSEIDVPYAVDAIVCRDVTPRAAHNGFVTLDDGFVPVEISGEWFVDNMRGAAEGEAAAHPPVIEPGGEKTMTLNCGEPNTQLTFVVRRLSDNTELELFDGDQSRGKIEVNAAWSQLVINVPQAEHSYHLVARNLGTTTISEPYVIDTIVCRNTDPTRASKGLVTLDDGFWPMEVSGEWFVDNMRGAAQGEAAVHPPVIESEEDAEMTFACDEDHTALTFVVRRLSDDTELELFDGAESRGTIAVNAAWSAMTYEVDEGPHEYTFVARNLGTTQISEPYVIDTLNCE